ncbi:MAG TPA: hypothetical protein VLA04_04110 [Verrucomicrobiae bacterium]|nr:hypothetical protein [Verrucomicrobiae bacterium]
MVQHTDVETRGGFGIEHQFGTSIAEGIATLSKKTETPHHAPVARNILLIAGVNGAGKGEIEHLFPPELVHGMSAAYIPEVCTWWNYLTVEQQRVFAGARIDEGDRHLFVGVVLSPEMMLPRPDDSDEVKLRAYTLKSKFAKIITLYMQWARDPEHGGHTHAVIDRVFRSINTRNGVISGVRTLSDFEYPFCHLGPYVNVKMVYIDAEIRRKDDIRAETERDLLKVWRVFRHHFPDKFIVVDNNGSKEEYLAQVQEVAPQLRAFLELD